MAGKIKIRIGIDPDVDKSGFCLIEHIPFKKPEIKILQCFDFFDVIDLLAHRYLKSLNEQTELIIFIEAGFLNKKSNFRQMIKKGGKWVAAPDAVKEKMASNTGENHCIGKLFELYCKKNRIPYKLYKPVSKKWDAKIFKMITGFTQRTNPEMRDAVRAAWV